MEHTFTKLLDAKDPDGIGKDVWCCNDCGATEQGPETIRHHKTCVAGEAKRWEQFYAENDDS